MKNSVNFDRPVYMLLGLPVDCVNTSQAQERLESAALQNHPCFLSTPNLNFLIAARQDPAFRMSVIDSDLVVADGMPLVWVARWIGIPLPERVAGSTLVERLRVTQNGRRPLKVFFFGGLEGIAKKAHLILEKESRGLTSVGAYYPGFGTVEEMCAPEVVREINAADPDVVIVSLGAKKGQLWIQRMRQQLNAPVISHLGAVVNFIAGTVSRAPIWMQKIGLEWLWRIYEEPALFKRYWSDGQVFLSLLWKNVRPLKKMAQQTTEMAKSLPSCVFEIQLSNDAIHIVSLKGRAIADDLHELRRALSELCRKTPSDIQIDMTDCQYVDAAFLGLLCLLLKQQRQTSYRLRITGLSLYVRQQFGFHGADFLLED